MQTPGYGFKQINGGLKSTVHIDIPRDHDVMASFESVWIPARARLTIGTSEDSVWLTGRPVSVLSQARLLPGWPKGRLTVSYLDCVFCGEVVRRVGFKLRFTFHRVRTTSVSVWFACRFVGWLLNVPATCSCILETDLLRQFHVLPH